MFDQLGFGFHRYSTDAEWLVPHFEKMLYDQALLGISYLEGFQATDNEEFAATARDVLHYVMRDLSSEEGGYLSAEDADTEGEEGKFYLWTEQEIRDVLPRADADLALKVFGVEAQGNYSDSGERGRNRKNVLHTRKTLDELAASLKVGEAELDSRIREIRQMLYETRQKRVQPAKDGKILTDWNGLMIAAFAKASQIFDASKYLDAAVGAADFLLAKMCDTDGTLFHRYVEGERAVEGFLDDYAFLAWGLVEVYEASCDEKYLKAALQLTDAMMTRFWDGANGGFFFTSKDMIDVLVRRKEVYDGALPSGNSVALLNLLRLARLSNNADYEDKAAHIIRAFAGDVKGSPAAHTFFLLGVDFSVGPAYNVILVGESNWDSTQDMIIPLRKSYLPNLVFSLKAPDTARLGYEVLGGKTTAYVCRGQMCLPPTNEKSKMLEFLNLRP